VRSTHRCVRIIAACFGGFDGRPQRPNKKRRSRTNPERRGKGLQPPGRTGPSGGPSGQVGGQNMTVDCRKDGSWPQRCPSRGYRVRCPRSTVDLPNNDDRERFTAAQPPARQGRSSTGRKSTRRGSGGEAGPRRMFGRSGADANRAGREATAGGGSGPADDRPPGARPPAVGTICRWTTRARRHDPDGTTSRGHT